MAKTKTHYVTREEAERILTQPNGVRFVEDVRKPYEPLQPGLAGVVNGEKVFIKYGS